MDLSAEMFAEIVDHLKGSMVDGRNKRSTPRVGMRTLVTLKPLGLQGQKNRPTLTARVRDISPRGLGLLCDHALPVNSHFAIRLSGRSGKSGNSGDLNIVCMVQYCKPLAENLYGIGASVRTVRSATGRSAA
jgi:hypothetical protein